jgi:acetylglutamate kinase
MSDTVGSVRLDEIQEKARILTEALPYIRRWSGKTMVVKVGGETVEEQTHLESFVRDVVLLRFVGVNPVIVHGGGPQISEEMRRLGKEPAFAGGYRITDAETMNIVKSVLMEDINRRIVAAVNAGGGRSTGLSGESGNLLVARQRLGPDGEDLGFVGDVETVNPDIIQGLVESGFVPVVAPIAVGPGGSYNINADLAAGSLAAALGAQKIVLLTNVPGLYRDLGDEGSLISEISVEDCERLVSSGELSAGMNPKIASVVLAIRGGVPQAHILDGRILHALLLEVFTDEGIGTMVLP